MRDPSWWGVGIGLAMVAAAFVGRQGGSLFAPARVFLLAHGAALAIAFLNMHEGMTPWNIPMLLLYPGAVLSFLAGCAAFQAWGADPVSPKKPVAIDGPGLIVLVAPFFLVLVAGVGIALRRFGTFPLFADANREMARKAFLEASSLTAIGVSFHVLLVSVAAFLAVFGTDLKIRLAGWGMFLVAGAVVLLMGIRNPFLMQVFVLVALWDLGRSRLKLWRLGIVGAGFMALFILVALVRSGVDISPDSLFAMGKIAQRGEVFAMAFKPIYVYIANNFWNLDYGVMRMVQGGGHPDTWGASSMEAVFALMGISGDLCERMGWDTFLNESNMKVHGLNTFTYLWPLYKDGGLFLAFGFSWVWGAVMTWLYRKAVGGDAFDKLIYAYLLFAVGFSFFALYAQVGTYLLSGGILLAMNRMMRGDRLLPPLRMHT